MPSFEARLKELRNEKELTQKDLGRILGVSKNAITMYEKGERTPKYAKLEEIADFFNVDMEYLMGKAEFKTKYEWNISLQNDSPVIENHVDPLPLTQQEKQLLENFRELNEEGRHMVSSQVNALSVSGLYKKHDVHELDEENPPSAI